MPDYPRLLENGLDGMLALIDRYAVENVRDREESWTFRAGYGKSGICVWGRAGNGTGSL